MEELKNQDIPFEQLLSRGCKSASHCSSENSHMHSCSKLNAFDWLATLPPVSNRGIFDCIEVRFKNNRKDFFRMQNEHQFHSGDIVAVEASPGHDIGIVTLTGEIVRLQMNRKGVNAAKEELKKVYRKAKQTDIDKWIAAIKREDAGIVKCRQFASTLGLKMKVNDVEFQGDDTKATFYYTADDRVDFRELIKLLADEFKVRIEMKQIGVRQEAARLGGIGSCGRPLCCSSWMHSFQSVSTTAARVQQLSPNPQKLAGQCSKLKCCLNYEFASYNDALKDFPAENTVLKTKSGDAVIQKIDVFGRIIWFSYRTDDMDFYAIPLEEVKKIIAMNKSGKIPQNLEEFARKQEKKSQVFYAGTNEDLSRFDKDKRK